MTLGGSLASFVPQGAAMSSLNLQVTPGSTYTLAAGYRYLLDSDSLVTWGATSPATVSSDYLSILTDSGKTVNNAIAVGGAKYLVNAQTLLNVSADYDNYGLAVADFIPVADSYFPARQSSSILVGTPGSGKVWLLSQGKRYYIQTPDVLYDLGYGRTAGITSLQQDLIATFPEQPSPATHLVRAAGGGVILASNGLGYGFRSSADLHRYIDGQTVQTLPVIDFNKFAFVGWAEQLVVGTDGKVYAMDGGQKHWVAGPALLNKYYAGVPVLYLPQSTVNSIPTGSTISS
jgi:hypothetical protein